MELEHLDYSSGIIEKSPELIKELTLLMDRGVSTPRNINERVDKEIKSTLKKLPVHVFLGLPSFLRSMCDNAIDYGVMSAEDSSLRIQDPLDYEGIVRKINETILTDSKYLADQKLIILELAQFAFCVSRDNAQLDFQNRRSPYQEVIN
jgi:hypothetical protein